MPILNRGGRPLRGRAGPQGAPAPAGIRLIDAPPVPGEESLGVIVDGRAGTYSAALAVGGRSFSLLGQSDKERRLAAWGAVLAGLCREGNPIHRLQWVERAVPGERHGLQRYLDEAATRPA